jgi:hypothetical protein
MRRQMSSRDGSVSPCVFVCVRGRVGEWADELHRGDCVTVREQGEMWRIVQSRTALRRLASTDRSGLPPSIRDAVEGAAAGARGQRVAEIKRCEWLSHF